MKIPDCYQITPEPTNSPHFGMFLSELTETLRSGIKLLQFRAKNLSEDDHFDLARGVREICRQHGAILILNGPIELAQEAGCDGVHLNSDTLMSLEERPASRPFLISAACHDAEQLDQAARIGADFVTLSPVLQTGTHPDAMPLGWTRFAELVQGSHVPVFALGGMRAEMLGQAKDAGAYGIAAISGTWRHPRTCV